jgi:hypothetical protein
VVDIFKYLRSGGLDWHSGTGCTQADQTSKSIRKNGTWPVVFAEIEEQFEVNLFQGLVQVLAVKQKKRRSEDMKKRIQAASQKRIVRSPPIFGLSLPLTACPGSSKSREVFGVYQNFRDLFGSSQGS